MKTRGSWKYAVIGLAVICLALPASLFAQQAPAKVFKQEELEQLLAPIALYPDDLLTQILMASTYPLEVVQAERWAKQNKSLKGDALKAALEKQTWDDSVKALVPFPDVLTMMSEKLDWTQKLGDAFLAQQKDVMDTVQKLRRKAAEAGNLKSSKEQEVKKEGDIIIVQAANPQVVYVPAYNPTVVYGAWAYPAYPPYPVYAYPPGAALFTFTMGVAVGAAWYGHGCHADYHGGTVNIDRSTTIDRPAQPGTRPSGQGPGEVQRASSGSTTRSTGKGFPTGTRGHATSIPRQTVRPWTTVRVTAVTTSRRQAHPIGPPASNRRRAHPIALAAVSRPTGQNARSIGFRGKEPEQCIRRDGPQRGTSATGQRERQPEHVFGQVPWRRRRRIRRPSGGGASRGGGGRGRR